MYEDTLSNIYFLTCRFLFPVFLNLWDTGIFSSWQEIHRRIHCKYSHRWCLLRLRTRRPYLWHQCSTLGHCVPCLLQQSDGFFFVPIEQVRKPPFRRLAVSIPIHSHNTICTFRKCHLPVLCPVQKAEIPHPYCHRELPVFHSNRLLHPRKFLFQAMDNDAYHLGISFQSTHPMRGAANQFGILSFPHFYFYYITLASNPLYFFILSVIIKGTELF